MRKDFVDLTTRESAAIGALETVVQKQPVNVSDLLAAVAKTVSRRKKYKARERRETRKCLAYIYQIFMSAYHNKEQAQEISDHIKQTIDQNGRGHFLNTLISTCAKVSKQRSYTLSLIVRRAGREGIAPDQFAEWLQSLTNLDKEAQAYLERLRAEAEDDRRALCLGENWDAGLRVVLAKAREIASARTLRVRIRCRPDGRIDFLERVK